MSSRKYQNYVQILKTNNLFFALRMITATRLACIPGIYQTWYYKWNLTCCWNDIPKPHSLAPFSHVVSVFMIMKVNLFRGVVRSVENRLESSLLHINTEPCAYMRPLVPRLQTAGFQTAGCNGVWREKMQSHNRKASEPAFLHTDNTTAPDNQGQNMAELTHCFYGLFLQINLGV